MNLAAFSTGHLQTARSLLLAAHRDGLSISETIALIDRSLDPVDPVLPVSRRSGRQAPADEQLCPSCGRFVLVTPRGVAEPVLVCPACRYSIYQGVR